MSAPLRLAIVAALAAGIVATFIARERVRRAGAAERAVAAATASPGLPRFVDLGAGKCASCTAMKPVLEELRKSFAGALTVEFIDVWENPGAEETYGIQLIPTQIFYDAAGKELFRHEGFMSKEDILAKWKELGVDLSGGLR